MRWKSVVKAGKGITLVISNEDMDDIIRIIKSLASLEASNDGVSETVKQELKKQEGGLRALLGTLDASMFGNILTGKWIMLAGWFYKSRKKIW